MAVCMGLGYAGYPVKVPRQPLPDTPSIAPALQYVNGAAFIRAGLTGKNVKVGVVDVGFEGADKNPRLQNFFTARKLAATKDFIHPNEQVLFSKQTDMDWHGTYVWSYIGGKDAAGKRYGLATDAVFYLARTDDGAKEYQKEQEYFRDAVEWLHTQGVRVVNVSLGYAYDFDNPAENYVPENMNGQTAIVTKAAREAAARYNMILVIAAGNDGDNPWKIISAPADADNVIAVGATDMNRSKKTFSAEGPDFLPYLKPNISCLNDTGGTSFSAPVISGVVACMLQQQPNITARQVVRIIERSGHLYPYGNNYEGYGVPDAARILQLMKDSTHDFKTARQIKASGNELQLPSDGTGKDWVLFHKKDNWIVLEQQQLKQDGGQITIKRPAPLTRTKLVVDDKIKAAFHTTDTQEAVKRTTVATSQNVIEIVWP